MMKVAMRDVDVLEVLRDAFSVGASGQDRDHFAQNCLRSSV
jgi:hypothetical protein